MTFFFNHGLPPLLSGRQVQASHRLNLRESPLYGHGAGCPMACHTSLQCKKLRLLETRGWQPMLWCRAWPHQASGWHHQGTCPSQGGGGRTPGKPRKKKKKRQSKMHHDRKERHSAALDKTPFPVVCIVVFHHILPPSEWRCLFSHRFLTFSAKSSGPGDTEDTVNKDSSAYCLNPTRSTSKC